MSPINLSPENLTLAAVFDHPESVSYHLELADTSRVLLRPLLYGDAAELAAFLGGLSAATRHFSMFASYDLPMAQELCTAINRFDKLRFVVEVLDAATIIGLFEFSFDLPEKDLQRFAQHGVELDARRDCRFGPTIADAYQHQGLGRRIFPYMVEIARRFGKARIVLWGGVLAENARAIRFYEKQGFQPVGMFDAGDGLLSFDMILAI